MDADTAAKIAIIKEAKRVAASYSMTQELPSRNINASPPGSPQQDQQSRTSRPLSLSYEALNRHITPAKYREILRSPAGQQLQHFNAGPGDSRARRRDEVTRHHLEIYRGVQRARLEAEIKREIVDDIWRKKTRKYSEPPLEEEVTLSWPLIEYSKRRHDQEIKPIVFFDVSRDPTNSSYGIVRLIFENGEELPEAEAKQILEMPLSPEKHFTMIQIQCDDDVLATWDVIVQRDDGLRVIDVFKGIWETYNISLTTKEHADHYEVASSYECEDAFGRRCAYIPSLMEATMMRDLSRIDLLGNRVLFNGFEFDIVYKQYHFKLLERNRKDLLLSPMF